MVMNPKLERALPLLEHLAEGGRLHAVGLEADLGMYAVCVGNIIDNPERYTIKREPREVFVNEYNCSPNSWGCHPSKALADQNNCRIRISRWVEDLNWKPEELK